MNTNSEWIYYDTAVLPFEIDYYFGKYIHQVDEKEFSILVNKRHIEQLHLLLAFCVDQEKLNNTCQAKYLYQELKQEIEDILYGGTENRKRLERKYR